MKIAIIVRKLNVRGGVQRHALHLTRELKNLGHQVKIYTFSYSKEDCYPELLDGLLVVSLAHLPEPSRVKALGYLNYFIGLRREAAAAEKLAAMIDRDTEILNPHDHVCYKVAYFFKRNFKNIPSVWTMHDLPTKTFSLLRERGLGSEASFNPLKRFFYWLVDGYEINKYIRRQNAMAVLDERDRQWAKKYFNKDAVVVRNGVDAERFFLSPRHPIAGRRLKVFMNGIFMPHRRFEDGLKAAKILLGRGYDVNIEIAGDYGAGNEYYGKIAQLASELKIASRVKFLGLVSESELLDAYRRNDIFIFPNHLQSWGLAVFEAMASGLPVIVSKSSGASEILAQEENALLVNPKMPGEIADAAAKLSNSPDLYMKLSRNGRRFVEVNISWGRLAKTMDGIFNSIKK